SQVLKTGEKKGFYGGSWKKTAMCAPEFRGEGASAPPRARQGNAFAVGSVLHEAAHAAQHGEGRGAGLQRGEFRREVAMRQGHVERFAGTRALGEAQLETRRRAGELRALHHTRERGSVFARLRAQFDLVRSRVHGDG